MYSHYSLSLVSHSKPKTYIAASKHECWKQAMHLELLALEKMGTWKIVELPSGVKLVFYQWVYKIKYLFYSSIDRFKPRLVASGYNQIKGLNYVIPTHQLPKLLL